MKEIKNMITRKMAHIKELQDEIEGFTNEREQYDYDKKVLRDSIKKKDVEIEEIMELNLKVKNENNKLMCQLNGLL